MGIDARMFVRRRGEPLVEREVREIAARMCATLGHENFFLMRGDEAWQEGRSRHALSIVEDTVAATLAEYAGWPEGRAPLAGKPADRQVWVQDGPPIVADADEQFIEVHLFTRFYGPDYERGDWTLIRSVAEFLEVAFPGAQVWYGGDSSGVCAELLDAEARDTMNAHFYGCGHEPYRGYFGRTGPPAETCAFCADRPMNNVGGGQGSTFWQCDGCGLERTTEPGKPPRDLKKGESFFGSSPAAT